MYEVIESLFWYFYKPEEEYSPTKQTAFKINNPEGDPNTDKMMIIKCTEKESYKSEFLVAPICGVLYKEINDTLITWSGIDPYYQMNSLIWDTKDGAWVLPERNFIKNHHNWRRTVHNGKLQKQEIK